MSKTSKRSPEDTDPSSIPANVVRLRGRISTPPDARELPSGDVILTLRVSVPRDRTPMTHGSKQQADWVDCSVWGARMKRTAARWLAGDVVEIEGALRRRFYRGADGTATRLEVEILSGRLVARAEKAVRSRTKSAEAV
jgi:single-strand DNA-binding protein